MVNKLLDQMKIATYLTQEELDSYKHTHKLITMTSIYVNFGLLFLFLNLLAGIIYKGIHERKNWRANQNRPKITKDSLK